MVARVKLGKELVAASAVPLVLAILRDGESYGYAILQRVAELSDGEIEWTEGMLYPVLHRLEERGCIRARWAKAPSGRRRKYYALRQPGRQLLAEQQRQWAAVQQTMARLWEPRHA